MNAKRMILVGLLPLALGAVGCSGAKSAETPAGYYPPSEQAPANYGGNPAGQPAPMAPPGVAEDSGGGEGEGETYAPSRKSESRPGLATSWGEARHSKVTTAPFVRADQSSPFAVGKLFYNDPSGISAMSGGMAQDRHRFAIGAGHLEFGLRDGSGNFLSGFTSSGENYMAGIAGRRYSIVIKNHSPGRVEAVVTVDGLDVIDGASGSFKKRGYLIEPYGELEIEGFRTSTSEVAAFRFGSVESSYAAKKHGETRNVGVIGIALFHENGDSPSFWGTPNNGSDAFTRKGADPFPQEYATPP